MRTCKALAFDFGASTGRAILGTLSEGKLTYREVYRFDNVPVQKGETLYWDIDQLTEGIKTGIALAGDFDSIAFDTWGVDFGLLDADGKLLAPPVHYRDQRTAGLADEVIGQIGAEQLYRLTGNQTMEINTLFQLLALRKQQPELLEKAHRLLFMPDLFAYLVSGAAVCEHTIASTSQMLSPVTGTWCRDMLKQLGIPGGLLQNITESGTVTGELSNGAKVIAAAGHDTQCAIAAVPSMSEQTAFLSCGTWSLLGTELDEPILSAKSMQLGLSNEMGANGKINYLKNIIGLWLIQESRRQWQREGLDYSFAQIAAMAEEAQPFTCFIDPDDPLFVSPGDMPGRIREYCRKTGQQEPTTVGAIARCIYESLALKYRLALEQINDAAGKNIDTLHIIGGGSQASILCRMTACSCGIRVSAGPVEATALGNLLIQFTALNALEDLEKGRQLIAESEPLTWYEPEHTDAWEQAYQRFLKLL